MDQKMQVEVLKRLVTAEELIAGFTQDWKRLSREQYHPAPPPPLRNVIERTYPEIKPTRKFNWKVAFLPLVIAIVLSFVLSFVITMMNGYMISTPLGFLTFLAIIWIPVYYFAVHRKNRKEEVEQIRNSAAYKGQCALVDQEFDRMQAEADAVYWSQQNEYDTVILPRYQQELADWTKLHNEQIQTIEDNLNTLTTNLEDLYATSMLVPLPYRNIESLQYIYGVISTSDFDVRYAIELYDKKLQRDLEQERIYEQQQANYLADEQNSLQQEQNEIAAKTRRDQNIAASVATYQRHKTNKALKDISRR